MLSFSNMDAPDDGRNGGFGASVKGKGPATPLEAFSLKVNQTQIVEFLVPYNTPRAAAIRAWGSTYCIHELSGTRFMIFRPGSPASWTNVSKESTAAAPKLTISPFDAVRIVRREMAKCPDVSSVTCTDWNGNAITENNIPYLALTPLPLAAFPEGTNANVHTTENGIVWTGVAPQQQLAPASAGTPPQQAMSAGQLVQPAAITQMPNPHVALSQQPPAVNSALAPPVLQPFAAHAQAPIFNGTPATPPFTMQSHQPLGVFHPPSMAMQAPPQQAPPQLMPPADGAPLPSSTPAPNQQLAQHVVPNAACAQTQATVPSGLGFDGTSNVAASPLPPQQQMANTLGSMHTTLDNVSVHFSRELRELQTSIANSIDTKIEASFVTMLDKLDSMTTRLYAASPY